MPTSDVRSTVDPRPRARRRSGSTACVVDDHRRSTRGRRWSTGISRSEVATWAGQGHDRRPGRHDALASGSTEGARVRRRRRRAGRRGRATPWTPSPTSPSTVVYADDDLIVVDKPAGLVVHPGAGQPSRARSCTGCWPATPSWPASAATPIGPASSTGSTRAPPACCSWPARRAAYDALVAQLPAHEVERRYLALVWGELDALERHDRRAHRPLGRASPPA